MQYLTLPELLNLTRRLGTPEVRDYGLLESALARPQASVFGQDAYPDVWQKAAALMESLAETTGWWTATSGSRGTRPGSSFT